MKNCIVKLHDTDTSSISVEVSSLEWGDMGLCQDTPGYDRNHIYMTPAQVDMLRKFLAVYPESQGV